MSDFLVNSDQSQVENSALSKIGVLIGLFVTVIGLTIAISNEPARFYEVIKESGITIISGAILLGLAFLYFYSYSLNKNAFFLFIAFSWLFNLFYMIFITGWFSKEKTTTYLLLQALLSLLSDFYLYLANKVSKKNEFDLRSLILPALLLCGWFLLYFIGSKLNIVKVELILRAIFIVLPIWSFYLLFITGRTVSERFEDSHSLFSDIFSWTFKIYAVLQLFFIAIAFDLTVEDTKVILSEYTVITILAVTVLSIILKIFNGLSLGFLLRESFEKNIEAQKKLEYELRHTNRRYKEEEEKKKEFEDLFNVTSGIEHELRNPLSVTISTLLTLKRKYQSDEYLRKKLELLNSSCKGMKVAVQLVKILRSTDEQIHYKSKEIYLKDFLTSIKKKIELEFEKSGLYFPSIKIEEKKQNLRINGVQDLLEKVFVNLIKNSIDSIIVKENEKGNVIIELGIDEQDNNKVIVSIRDNGVGFVDENGNVLNEWQILNCIRADYSTKKDSNSNHGIGLFVSDKILKLHRGEMHLNNIIIDHDDGKKELLGAETLIMLDRIIR